MRYLSAYKTAAFFSPFLRTYTLPQPIAVESEPICEQLYKFIPLPRYLEVGTESSVYSDEDFSTAKQSILEPKNDELKSPDALN